MGAQIDFLELKIANLEQTIVHMKADASQLIRENDRLSQGKPNSNENKHVVMPETEIFMQDYLYAHKRALSAIDPTTKSTKLRIRRLLADLLHQALDSIADDVIEDFEFPRKAHNGDDGRRVYEDEEEVDRLIMEEMEMEQKAGVEGELDEEMEELRVVVGEAVDGVLW